MKTSESNQEIHGPVLLERMATGVPGLDTVLGGGFVRGAIYLVMGRPGTGKTTFGNQICFTHVKRGGRAAYVTLLAESHASMVKNLQTLSFFDAAAMNRELVYIGAYKALRDDKLRGLLGLLRQVIEDERASLVVLDGIAPARALAGSDLALKEFIVELQVLGTMTNCTTVLLANMAAEDANGPEHTMVDGLFELGFERSKRRTLRTLEVLKFRGSKHLLGRQELSITADGLFVYPRLEDLLATHLRPPAASGRRMSTGLPGLDEMLGGGLLSGTTTVLLGFTGSGKTTLCMHFLDDGASRGENSLYFGFYEAPSRVLATADQLGLKLREYEAAGTFAQIWQGAHEFGLDELAERLLADIERRKVQRVVIDGIDALRQAAFEPDRMIRYLTALTNELRARNITTLITDETAKARGPEIELRIEGTSALAENLILLEYVSVGTELRRMLSVVKQRSSSYQPELREFTLNSRGIELSPDRSSAEAILRGADELWSRTNRRSRAPESD